MSEHRLFIRNIRNKILLHSKIKLFSIRTHKGNERADLLAKETSCKINIEIGCYLSDHHIKKKLEEKYSGVVESTMRRDWQGRNSVELYKGR